MVLSFLANDNVYAQCSDKEYRAAQEAFKRATAPLQAESAAVELARKNQDQSNYLEFNRMEASLDIKQEPLRLKYLGKCLGYTEKDMCNYKIKKAYETLGQEPPKTTRPIRMPNVSGHKAL